MTPPTTRVTRADVLAAARKRRQNWCVRVYVTEDTRCVLWDEYQNVLAMADTLAELLRKVEGE